MILYLALSGCQATQVANKTFHQSSTLPEIQYMQVMDNLAIMADNPSSLPYFNPLTSSKTTIQRTGQSTFGFQWGYTGLLSHTRNLAHGMLTKTFGPLLFNQISTQPQVVQQNIEEWDSSLYLDPIREIVMQGLYRKVLGYPNTPFQLRLVQKFFYDYPNYDFADTSMLMPDGLWSNADRAADLSLQQNALKARLDNAIKAGSPPADVWEAFEYSERNILDGLNRLQLPEASQAWARKNAMDKVGIAIQDLTKQKADVTSKAVFDAATALGILAQQLKDQRLPRERGDSAANYNSEFRELYHSLQPGWVNKGTYKDVPKDACYVGRHGKTYVWVTSDGLERLTNLTIAMIDVATVDTSQSGVTSTPFAQPPSAAQGPPPIGSTAAAAQPALPPVAISPTPGTTVNYYPQVIMMPAAQPAAAARGRVAPIPSSGPNVVPAPP